MSIKEGRKVWFKSENVERLNSSRTAVTAILSYDRKQCFKGMFTHTVVGFYLSKLASFL